MSYSLVRLTPQHDGVAQPHRCRSVMHRFLSSLFPDQCFVQGGPRPFLWYRDPSQGRVMLLTAYPLGVGYVNGYDIEQKEYDPQIEEGERLSFFLQANPVQRGRKDWVQANGLPRHTADPSQVLHWLANQGARHGFAAAPPDVELSNWQWVKKKGYGLRLLDYSGRLTVVNPALFLQALLGGVGRSKSLGCGLLQVQRSL